MTTPTPRDFGFVAAQFALLVLFLVDVAALRLPLPEWVRWLSVALVIAGSGKSFLSLLQLRTSLTPWPTPRAGGQLVTTGMYAYARHPIYGGILLLALGLSLYSRSGFHLMVSAVLYGLLYYKSVYEEDLLQKAYPGYAQYAAKRRRF